MSNSPELISWMEGGQAKARKWAVIGLVASAVGFLFLKGELQQFYQSYLQAYLFWLGISTGSLALLMIHHLAGGGWSHSARRVFEASTRTIPLTLVLFIPIVFGMHDLYHWSHADAVAHDEILQHKSLYLNSKFFLGRAAFYFLSWMIVGQLLCSWSIKQDRNGDETLNRPARILSGIGIVLYSLTITFAGWDWTMSLEPHWFSSMWGPLFGVGQILTALGLTIIILARISDFEPLNSVIQRVHFHNIGNLTFAFVILWTYMTFGQFLIIWSGNLPEEITWYLDRSSTGWKLVAILLTLFHFALPFFILLSRLSKLNKRVLAKVCLVIILPMRLVDNYWVIAPTFHETVQLHLLDFALPVAIGGIWMWFFFNGLKKHSVLPVHDPRFEHDFPVSTPAEHS